MPNHVRQHPRRPILTAMKNPCGCKGAPAPEREQNPPGGGGGGGHGGHGGGFGRGFGWWGGGYPWWGGYGWPYNYAAPYSYAYAQQPTAGEWLPATKGPAPRGETAWVLWSGGSTGTKVRAGSAISQQVQILETAKGGTTGTLVRVAPVQPIAPAYAPAYAPYAYPQAYAVRRF